jgi:hypothetical protein
MKLASMLLVPIALVGSIQAQEIHIRVLNGKNGRPIQDECVNVWFGRLRGSSFIAPTNAQGVVILHLHDDQVSADAVSHSPCAKFAYTGPQQIPPKADTIYVWPFNYAGCEEYGKIAPGQKVDGDLPEKRTPSHSIKQILESGTVASNQCGKAHVVPKPGELVYFVRPLTFWEKMRL